MILMGPQSHSVKEWFFLCANVTLDFNIFIMCYFPENKNQIQIVRNPAPRNLQPVLSL